MAESHIEKQFELIGHRIYVAATEGLEAGVEKAAQALVERLKLRSPRRLGGKEKYARGWIIKKGRGRRYVGNTTAVKGKKDAQIPLSNILEFGTPNMQPRLHIRDTFDSMEQELADIISAEIAKSIQGGA